MTERKEGDEIDAEYSDEPDQTVSFDHYDWVRADDPSVAVVEAVAAVTNESVLALPPLQEAVDVDAPDDAVRSGDGSVTRVSFPYAGTTATLSSDGLVEITPLRD